MVATILAVALAAGVGGAVGSIVTNDSSGGHGDRGGAPEWFRGPDGPGGHGGSDGNSFGFGRQHGLPGQQNPWQLPPRGGSSGSGSSGGSGSSSGQGT